MTIGVIYRNPKISIATTAEDKQRCTDVRTQVFINELGYPPVVESLEYVPFFFIYTVYEL